MNSCRSESSRAASTRVVGVAGRASFVLAVMVLAGCTSNAAADEPREIDIVTVFEQPGGSSSNADGTGVDVPTGASGSGDEVSVPTIDAAAPDRTVPQTSTVPTVVIDDDGPDGASPTTSSPAEPGPTTTRPRTTLAPATTVPDEIWRVGLLNQDDSAFGSYPAFRIGVAAAVNWSNGGGHVDGDRQIELIPCAVRDTASAAACAQSLVDQGVDAVVHGIDVFSDVSLPVLEASGVPTLSGIAVRPVDARATHAALTIGGPAAEHAGLADAVVTLGFGSTVVLHDDTTTGHSLVDEFITPVLDANGVAVVKVPVPVDTTDATGAVAPAAVAEADSWIVVTSTGTCQPVVVSRSAYGVTAATFYSSSCTDDATLSAVGTLMDNSFFTTELVTPLWFGVVSPDLRDARALASAVIAQTDPDLADDELAIMGHVAGSTLVDQLRRGGADLANARIQIAPHPLGGGELDCGQSSTYPAICSGDVLLARYVDGVLVTPPQTVNGIRGR